ncbi:MAG: hypothetical protein IJF22_01810 [Clostridia bacterium]|nr:hypothetical protein [Clostridia bacterium]
MKFSQKIILNTGLSKYAYFVANTLGCSYFEIYQGDYKYNKVDGCKYKAILGNADFSGWHDLDLSNLKYVKGNLTVSETQNVKLGVEYVGKNLFGLNATNLDLSNLKEVGEGVYLDDATVVSMETLAKAKCIYFENNLVKKPSEFAKKENQHIEKDFEM